MTALQLFAFVLLPAIITAGAGISVLIFNARNPRRNEREPDLFDPPMPRRYAGNGEGLGRPTRSSR